MSTREQDTRIARACANARKKMGAGWNHVSGDVREALVTNELVVQIDLGNLSPKTAHALLARYRSVLLETPDRIVGGDGVG